jgi:decaprenylphospho-beta-D-erythro-pentofuranosid-2-ulose 2-reductase
MAIPTFQQCIVVGASSGIGEALAKALARGGAKVALLGRRADELERVAAAIKAKGGDARVYPHDVTHYEMVPALFDRIVADLGGLDCIVYASGAMPKVEEHEFNFHKDRQMIEVNVLGAMAWLNPAGAWFTAKGKGTILGISSIAGERGRRGAPVYCASKAALTAYLEALRNRLSRYGVSVVTIKPGFIDTVMTKDMKKTGLLKPISPDVAARHMLRIATRPSGQGFVPWRWTLVALIVRNIPSAIFRKLNI